MSRVTLRALVPAGALAALVFAVACGSSSPDHAPSPTEPDASPAAPDASPSDSAPAPLADASDADSSFVPACHAESVGPLPPDAGDVTYSYDPSATLPCFSNPFCQIGCSAAVSLVEGLLACAPVQGGYSWLFGSSYIRVHGIQAGSCVYDIGLAVEGSYKEVRCSTPLPVKAWTGLDFYAAVGGSPGMGDLSTGLDGCEVVTICETDGCGPPDASLDGGGLPADAPLCPTSGSPPDWC